MGRINLPTELLPNTGHRRVLSVSAGRLGFLAFGRRLVGEEILAFLWASDDGRSWRPLLAPGRPFDPASGTYVDKVIQDGPVLLAVGRSGRGDAGDAVVWSSTDGTAWERATAGGLGGAGEQEMLSVAWDGRAYTGWGSSARARRPAALLLALDRRPDLDEGAPADRRRRRHE